MENTSFVVVVIGEEAVEVSQYWEVPAYQKFDLIADAVAAFSNQHGVCDAIMRVIVRPINH